MLEEAGLLEDTSMLEDSSMIDSSMIDSSAMEDSSMINSSINNSTLNTGDEVSWKLSSQCVKDSLSCACGNFRSLTRLTAVADGTVGTGNVLAQPGSKLVFADPDPSHSINVVQNLTICSLHFFQNFRFPFISCLPLTQFFEYICDAGVGNFRISLDCRERVDHGTHRHTGSGKVPSVIFFARRVWFCYCEIPVSYKVVCPVQLRHFCTKRQCSRSGRIRNYIPVPSLRSGSVTGFLIPYFSILEKLIIFIFDSKKWWLFTSTESVWQQMSRKDLDRAGSTVINWPPGSVIRIADPLLGSDPWEILPGRGHCLYVLRFVFY